MKSFTKWKIDRVNKEIDKIFYEHPYANLYHSLHGIKVRLDKCFELSRKYMAELSKESKMDLKSIAVRFENVKQRKEIERKFEEAGVETYKPPLILKRNQGYLGIGTDDVVYNLTHYQDKKNIITYEEFMEGNGMKRLDIRRSYSDSNINVVQKRDEKDFAIVKNIEIDLKVGKDRMSIEKANAILKIMGLNYELYDGVNWSKVEVGREVDVSKEYENGMENWFTATFKEYIKDTNQIIVFNGNKVEVYDENEVGLCN